MPRFLKRFQLWLFYVAFFLVAVIYGGREGFFALDGPFASGKVAALITFFAFLAYSLYATHRENFFKTLGVMNSLWWGRQVGVDLYISVVLSLAIIWLNEGALLVLALWLVPVLFFANLAILPYIILNYGSLVERFIS